jgi:hypothetical protein
MEGAPPVANQIDLFMHFLGASRNGLVARRVDLDTISSSEPSCYTQRASGGYFTLKFSQLNSYQGNISKHGIL